MLSGKTAAHITYGLDTSLNAGAWLYFQAPVCINSNSISNELKLTLYQVYTNELRRLHLGHAVGAADKAAVGAAVPAVGPRHQRADGIDGIPDLLRAILSNSSR